jgi:hypothetical protein
VTLERLDLSARGWTTEDHWEGDLCAIGIRAESSDDRLVYVSTYGMSEGRYYYECEAASAESAAEYVVVKEANDVSFEQLLAAMHSHLDERRS